MADANIDIWEVKKIAISVDAFALLLNCTVAVTDTQLSFLTAICPREQY